MKNVRETDTKIHTKLYLYPAIFYFVPYTFSFWLTSEYKIWEKTKLRSTRPYKRLFRSIALIQGIKLFIFLWNFLSFLALKLKKYYSNLHILKQKIRIPSQKNEVCDKSLFFNTKAHFVTKKR